MKRTLFFTLAVFSFINVYSQTADYYNRQGSSKDSLKDYKGAIADYTRAIRINPKAADVYYYRGTAKYNLKDYPGAIADFTKTIEIVPSVMSS
jgi:tetratricopeptide (TPR) repeat protein